MKDGILSISGEILRHEIFMFLPKDYLYELNLVCRFFHNNIISLNLPKKLWSSLCSPWEYISVIEIKEKRYFLFYKKICNEFGRIIHDINVTRLNSIIHEKSFNDYITMKSNIVFTQVIGRKEILATHSENISRVYTKGADLYLAEDKCKIILGKFSYEDYLYRIDLNLEDIDKVEICMGYVLIYKDSKRYCIPILNTIY